MSHAFLSRILSALEPQHRKALLWFAEHVGEEVPWGALALGDGTRLVTLAKGIYKPAWSKYALSVRQTLKGKYPDEEPVNRADGTWYYRYFQESLDLNAVDSLFTNRGMFACYDDIVPVGVLRQTRPKPNVRYRVLGPALINGYDAGFFVLEGVLQQLDQRGWNEPSHGAVLTGALARADWVADALNPGFTDSQQEFALRAIKLRQGQPGFRRKLLQLYDGQCAISGYDSCESLEAAHIEPYRGPVTNHPSNGLLLRADLHTLFDLGLIGVRPRSLEVVLSREIQSSKYSRYAGRQVRSATDPNLRPSDRALQHHLERFKLG